MDLTGSTEVRFGCFTAMTGGKTLEDTETKPVWKVWYVYDEKKPGKIMAELTREQAVELARACAKEWRRIGKPEVHEVGVQRLADGTYALIINGHREHLEVRQS